MVDRPGGIFVRHADQIAARGPRPAAVGGARRSSATASGTLAEQLQRRLRAERRGAPRAARPSAGRTPAAPVARARARAAPSRRRRARVPTGDLALFNGYRRLRAGRPRVRHRAAGRRAHAGAVGQRDRQPALRHGDLGGRQRLHLGENAHEFRLTPWHNDPVSDPSGEAFYLRDEETGAVWSPTPLPCRDGDDGGAPYVARHGFGYSVFEHDGDGIRSELTVFVALDAPVKFSVLRAAQRRRAARASSASPATSSGCWATCARRRRRTSSPRSRSTTGALFARNPYSNDFADWIGFLRRRRSPAIGGSITCDRAEFIGRNGSLRAPAALRARAAVGPARRGARSVRRDPGAARASRRGEIAQVVFRLGMGRSADEADAAGAAASAAPSRPSRRSRRVRAHWERTLGAVQVRTPDAGARRAGQRLAALPDHRLPAVGAQRLLPVRRRVRLPRPAAGRDGAGARAARAAARAAAALRRAASSRRATCSTGGIRRRAAACARTSPTTTCGCRWRSCRYVEATGDAGVLDERGAVPRRPAGRRATTSPTTTCPAPSHAVGDALRARARARSSTACASARTACR